MKSTVAKEKFGSVDRFGRILIPKPLRERWGLTEGAKVVFEEDYEGLKIHPPYEACGLMPSKGFLVADVSADEEIEVKEAIVRGREERLERLRKAGER